MRVLALLIVGVVVGWAASGVDWSRDVRAQDALIDAPPSTLQQDVPDAPPQPTYRAAPADGNLDPSIQGPRHTEVMSQPSLVGRFQATAYGSPNGHGCYVVDTMTGKTWHVANGQQRQVVTEALGIQAGPILTTAPSILPRPVQAGDIDLSLP